MRRLATLPLLLLLAATPAPAASIFSCNFLAAVAIKLGLSSPIANPKSEVNEVERAVVQYQIGTMADVVNGSLRRGKFTSPYKEGDETIGDFDLSDAAVRNLVKILDTTIAKSRANGMAWDTRTERVAWRASSFAPSRMEPDLGFMSLSQDRAFTESLKGADKVMAVIIPKNVDILDTQKVYTSANAFAGMREVIAPRGSYLEPISRDKLLRELQNEIPASMPVYKLVVPTITANFAFFSVGQSTKLGESSTKLAGPNGAEELITQFKNDPTMANMYGRQSGFFDKDTIELHTRTVAQYATQLLPAELPTLASNINSRKIFNLLVALHDIGKGVAEDLGKRELQYAYTLPIVESVLRGMEATTQEREIIKSMIEAKTFSAVARNQMTPELAADNIRAEAARLGVDANAYFKIRDLFYRSDMLAHPTLRVQLFEKENLGKLKSEPYNQLKKLFP